MFARTIPFNLTCFFKNMEFRICIAVAGCLIAHLLSGSTACCNGPATVNFTSHIRPILQKHCLSCHGGVKQTADLSFIHRDTAFDVIVAGKPEQSEMMKRIRSKDPDEIMPPPEHGSALSDEEIDLLERWIEQGATWQQPWAYQPPLRKALPTVSSAAWCRQRLDHHVLARLDKEQLKPADDADSSQWLRRATLDITGLPPTPEAIQRFQQAVTRHGDEAYARKADELLESPGYGERWASVWLDQVRYADSRGLGADGRREIWKYRDWVIDAINSDMPFDEFTIKQIAGDLLPSSNIEDRLATAVHRLTQTNEEGGTDDEEFRINAILDRVSTVWQTWQGITFGCVQCHAHPYDPLQHEDFYRFAAFFNNTADCDLNSELPLLSVPLDPADNAMASRLDNEILRLQNLVWQKESILLDTPAAKWRPVTNMTASASKETEVAIERQQDHAEYYTVDTLSSNTEIKLSIPLNEGMNQLTAIRLTISPGNPATAKSDSEWGFVLSHVQAFLNTEDGKSTPLNFTRVIGDEPVPFKNPDDSLNNKTNDGFAAYSRIHYPRTAVFVVDSPMNLAKAGELEIRIRNGVTELGAFPLIAKRGHVALSNQPIFTAALNSPELLSDRQKLKGFQQERSNIPSSRVPVLSERPTHLKRPTHVFTRGLFLTKGKEVQSGVPEALPPLHVSQGGDKETKRTPDRLDLANWLVNGNNPLTARVTTNRVWARLFGVGIVATEEDFGSSGEAPTHPDLLDDLALQFQNEFQWSLKKLIRSIVLSSTYRQDNRIPDGTAETGTAKTDTANRLLARGPRFRMPAEMIRDNALFVSGLLSPQMHGPPVHPPIPAGIWKPFQGGDKWNTPNADDPNRYRKSIYTYTKRSIPFPMFAAFDAPSREFCAPRRLRSNTPLQALMTLNDVTFVECSKHLAEKLIRVSDNLNSRLKYGFLSVTSRNPNPTELKALTDLYQQCQREQASELDSMTAVASVLLNLDEIMSK